MSKLYEAKELLKDIGMPISQCSDICSWSLLAMSNLTENNSWNNATNEWIRIHDIIEFIKQNYNVVYAENSRETFRKQAMHAFRTAALIEDNGQPTNSPNYRYRITEEFLEVIKSFKSSSSYHFNLEKYLTVHDSLKATYASKKIMKKMPVKINEHDFTFSPGKHNVLQKAIIEEFAPRFAPNCECLYVGDTVEKDLWKNSKKLEVLGFQITVHEKMPDVVLYIEERNWIYFIEAVTSVGPMSPQRIIEIKEMTKNVKAGLIFITAFLDFKTYKSFSEQLAWETEVWIAELPDHMIHMNGDKFMGPR